MERLDPRIHPYRSDLAAVHLRDRVTADRYVEGRPLRCGVGVTAMRGAPDPMARQVSDLICGETFTVYDEGGGWAWGQCATDGYVGYVHADALSLPGAAPTHRVSAVRTFRFAQPDIKAPVLDTLPMNAAVTVVEDGPKWLRLDRGGYVSARHVVPAGTYETDWVAVARRLMGTPYLWGGRTSLGVDCSGLVQMALNACGRTCPRDSDLQRAGLGTLVAQGPAVSYRRGDVVFFPGHVGLMADETHLLHSTEFGPDVLEEPLEATVGRGNEILAVRRLDP